MIGLAPAMANSVMGVPFPVMDFLESFLNDVVETSVEDVRSQNQISVIRANNNWGSFGGCTHNSVGGVFSGYKILVWSIILSPSS